LRRRREDVHELVGHRREPADWVPRSTFIKRLERIR
jgi:hypothetical protein